MKSDFDIFHTKITTEGNVAVFLSAVSARAGKSLPRKFGKLAGSSVFSYVWPTTIDPSAVGFEPKSGILAFAVTAHPDFDDIPAESKPKLPKTWPNLPILVDSPGWSPVFSAGDLERRVPFDDIAVVERASFDGVSAALRVKASVHSPLLCVADGFKIASGKLPLPDKVNH